MYTSRIIGNFYGLKHPILITSWAGTSNVTVRKSTFRYSSMHGITKKIPGPDAPPRLMRPSRKITARWYSCTTYEKRVEEQTMLCVRIFTGLRLMWTHSDNIRQIRGHHFVVCITQSPWHRLESSIWDFYLLRAPKKVSYTQDLSSTGHASHSDKNDATVIKVTQWDTQTWKHLIALFLVGKLRDDLRTHT